MSQLFMPEIAPRYDADSQYVRDFVDAVHDLSSAAVETLLAYRPEDSEYGWRHLELEDDWHVTVINNPEQNMTSVHLDVPMYSRTLGMYRQPRNGRVPPQLSMTCRQHALGVRVMNLDDDLEQDRVSIGVLRHAELRLTAPRRIHSVEAAISDVFGGWSFSQNKLGASEDTAPWETVYGYRPRPTEVKQLTEISEQFLGSLAALGVNTNPDDDKALEKRG